MDTCARVYAQNLLGLLKKMVMLGFKWDVNFLVTNFLVTVECDFESISCYVTSSNHLIMTRMASHYRRLNAMEGL